MTDSRPQWALSSSTSGLAERARAHIEARLSSGLSSVEGRQLARREVARPFSRRLCRALITYYGALGVVAFAASRSGLEIAPVLSPLEGPNGLLVLWQVQVGLVAVALPFLFLLIPLVPTQELAATRTSLLLMEKTLINPILLFSLCGVAWVGVLALWLDEDAAKWCALLGVLFPSIAGVAYSYLQAARIISDPAYVRAESQRLLLDVVDQTLISQAAIEFANGELLRQISAVGIDVKAFVARDGEHALIVPGLTGVIVDVHAERLVDVLGSVLRSSESPLTAVREVDSDSLPDGVEVDSRLNGSLLRLVGDAVNLRTPLLALRRTAFAEFDPSVLARSVADCLVVRTDG